MALEQVFSDHDSEDEVDDDIADFEDRRVIWDNYFAQHFIIKYCLLSLLLQFGCRCLMILLMLRKTRSLLCICGIHLFENKGQCPSF
jgi:hypothetical protein